MFYKSIYIEIIYLSIQVVLKYIYLLFAPNELCSPVHQWIERHSETTDPIGYLRQRKTANTRQPDTHVNLVSSSTLTSLSQTSARLPQLENPFPKQTEPLRLARYIRNS